MPGTGERAYVYARSCGILGKSFVGKRLPLLSGLTGLSELDRLIFPQGTRELPERELLRDLESRISRHAVSQIISLLSSFRKPPEFFVRLLRVYEYGDLKSALSALAGGERQAPGAINLGPFQTVDFSAYPDFPVMLQGTEFNFLLKKTLRSLSPAESILIEAEIDRYYYTSLLKSLYALAPRDRVSAEKILAEEISLRNVLWALRLRTYYGMPGEEVRRHLMDGGEERLRGRKSGSFTSDAVSSLDFALDNRPDWTGWSREKFLNPPDSGGNWEADPRHFQNAASDHLYRLVYRAFHRNPSSLDSVFCFIKLKQFEEDILTSVAEGLGLGMTSGDVLSLLEVKR